MDTHIIPTKQKALRINLESNIYGTFAEIGAGQETVRNFFRAGGASGTIAKAMSAYDKDVSDDVYGIEADGRYVTESRVKRMLSFEMNLLERRLNRKKHPDKTFFTYANTVTTINYAKSRKGNGWVGVKFQLDPLEEYNDILIHIKFLENDARLQQETLGILGVNLIYGCYFLHDNPKELLLSLYDNLDKDQIEIDVINFIGPRFAYVDNRLMSLQLVKNQMTNAIAFGPDGNNILPSQILYKKNVLALRGSFRPVTNVNIDMLDNALKVFLKEKKVEKEKTRVIFEITINNLIENTGKLNEKDFLDRADILCSMGHTVLISNFSEYYKLVDYVSTFTKNAKIGVVMGVQNLLQLFEEKYYRDLSGGIMEAFGILFTRNLKIYLYPQKDENGNIITSDNLKVHPRLKDLYVYFKTHGKIADLDFDENLLTINSREILSDIRNNKLDWETKIPKGVAEIIKSNRMFGYKKWHIKN